MTSVQQNTLVMCCFSLQIQKLETHSTNDARTIVQLTSEMKKINDKLRNTNAELSKQQGTVCLFYIASYCFYYFVTKD